MVGGFAGKFKTFITINYRYLKWTEIQLLAWNDGFDTAEEFMNWFKMDFIGKIIHWTDCKY